MTVVHRQSGVPVRPSLSIPEQRKLRQEVEGLAGLTGGGRRIKVVQGSWWSWNMVTGEMEWIPMWPFPPFAKIDSLGIRYCVPHEMSHAKYSGQYTTSKLIKDEERGQFHRFWNAIEDVRVDRLSNKEYGAFREPQVVVRTMLREQHTQTRAEGWPLVEAVGLNTCFAFEIGLPPQGSQLAIDASVKLWPRLSRIANLKSSQAVASALEPIFRKLVDIEAAEKARKEAEEQAERERRQQEAEEERRKRWEDQRTPEPSVDEGDEEEGEPEAEPGEGAGGEAPGGSPAEEGGADEEADDEGDEAGDQEGGEPVDGSEGDGSGDAHGADDGSSPGGMSASGDEEPEPDPLADLDKLKTDGADSPTDTPVKSEGDSDGPLPLGKELEGMESDDRETQRALREQETERAAQEGVARQLKQKQKPRRHGGSLLGGNRYEVRRDELRGQINTLAARLKAVLRQNAMENDESGHRRGRFDVGKAYRLKTGNPRVFSQPGSVGGLDYAFGILVDISSSMNRSVVDGKSTEEVDLAFSAVVLVAESLERAGLPFFVVLWDDVMKHVKPLREPLTEHRSPLGAACVGQGGTFEAPALALAIDQMKQVKGRRMVIVITDGDTEHIDQSKQLLDEMERAGIMPVAIRLHGQPARHYKRGYSIRHANELTVLLPKLINEVVRRGG